MRLVSLSGVDGVAVVLTSKTMRRNVGRRSVVAPEALYKWRSLG